MAEMESWDAHEAWVASLPDEERPFKLPGPLMVLEFDPTGTYLMMTPWLPPPHPPSPARHPAPILRPRYRRRRMTVPPPPPPSPAPPGVTIDHTSFPHIFDAVIEHASIEATAAIMRTSRWYYDQLRPKLYRHLNMILRFACKAAGDVLYKGESRKVTLSTVPWDIVNRLDVTCATVLYPQVPTPKGRVDVLRIGRNTNDRGKPHKFIPPNEALRFINFDARKVIFFDQGYLLSSPEYGANHTFEKVLVHMRSTWPLFIPFDKVVVIRYPSTLRHVVIDFSTFRPTRSEDPNPPAHQQDMHIVNDLLSILVPHELLASRDMKVTFVGMERVSYRWLAIEPFEGCRHCTSQNNQSEECENSEHIWRTRLPIWYSDLRDGPIEATIEFMTVAVYRTVTGAKEFANEFFM